MRTTYRQCQRWSLVDGLHDGRRSIVRMFRHIDHQNSSYTFNSIQLQHQQERRAFYFNIDNLQYLQNKQHTAKLALRVTEMFLLFVVVVFVMNDVLLRNGNDILLTHSALVQRFFFFSHFDIFAANTIINFPALNVTKLQSIWL